MIEVRSVSLGPDSLHLCGLLSGQYVSQFRDNLYILDKCLLHVYLDFHYLAFERSDFFFSTVGKSTLKH